MLVNWVSLIVIILSCKAFASANASISASQTAPGSGFKQNTVVKVAPALTERSTGLSSTILSVVRPGSSTTSRQLVSVFSPRPARPSFTSPVVCVETNGGTQGCLNASHPAPTLPAIPAWSNVTGCPNIAPTPKAMSCLLLSCMEQYTKYVTITTVCITTTTISEESQRKTTTMPFTTSEAFATRWGISDRSFTKNVPANLGRPYNCTEWPLTYEQFFANTSVCSSEANCGDKCLRDGKKFQTASWVIWSALVGTTLLSLIILASVYVFRRFENGKSSKSGPGPLRTQTPTGNQVSGRVRFAGEEAADERG